MLKSIGTDIVEIERLSKDVEQYGDRFLSRVLSSEEISIYEKRADKAQFLAGRFAAKEAIVKALGHYLKDKPPLNTIVITNTDSGTPIVNFSDEITSKLIGVTCLISISHEKNYAVAMATFVEEK